MHFKTPFFYEINGKRFEGKAGSCILHRPNTCIAHGPCSENTSFVNSWIYFNAEQEDADFLQILPTDKTVFLDDEKTFERLLTEITEETFFNDPYSNKLISNNIYRLLILLLRANDNQAPDRLTLQFQEIRIYIMNHLSQPWSLEDMAKLSNYSVSRFCALYKNFFNISPLNDLLENRLKTAKRLLANQTHKIGEVAELCGFSSIHYFSKFFKKHTGKSPNEYYQ